MRSVSVLGATGSIGASTLDLIRREPGKWRIVALTANGNAAGLARLAIEFRAEIAVVADENSLPELREALAGSGIVAAGGAAALVEAATRPADITVACLEDLSPQDNGNLAKSVSPNDPISAAYAYTYIHTVQVNGLPMDAKVTDLNALVEIDHELVDNLVIKLTSPAGKSMLLFNGGSCGVGRKHIDAVFDDEGANFACNGFPIAVSGTVKAQGSLLSLVDGDNPNGTWTFEVTDKAALGGGLIRTLGVDITYATALSVLPTAFDNASNCGIEFTHTDLDQKAQCAAGQVIRRQWRAEDPSGNASTCIQRITLQDNLPLIVDFPEDVTVSLMDLQEYAQSQMRNDLQDHGYSETPGERSIEVIGDVACVRQAFTMNFADRTVEAVDVFLLRRRGDGWRILSVASDMAQSTHDS